MTYKKPTFYKGGKRKNKTKKNHRRTMLRRKKHKKTKTLRGGKGSIRHPSPKPQSQSSTSQQVTKAYERAKQSSPMKLLGIAGDIQLGKKLKEGKDKEAFGKISSATLDSIKEEIAKLITSSSQESIDTQKKLEKVLDKKLNLKNWLQ